MIIDQALRIVNCKEHIHTIREIIHQCAVDGTLTGRKDTTSFITQLHKAIKEIITGPFGSSLHKSDYERGGTPVINPASLQKGRIVPIPEMAIGQRKLSEMASFRLQAGDIVVARRGEMGRCAVVTDKEIGWLCGTGSLILRPSETVTPNYLSLCISSPRARDFLGGNSVGTTMQNLNQSIMMRLEISLPPLAEQQRIVAKVDELMAVCDRLEAQLRERDTRHAALARAALARFAADPTPDNLQYLFHPAYDIAPADLRQSIISIAIRGKIAPQDNDDESADRIICRITETRPSEPSPHDKTQKKHWELPKSWTWVQLGILASIKHGYAFSGNLFTHEETSHILTTPGNFHETGGFRSRGASTKYYKGEVPRDFILNAGDLIIPMTEQAAGLLGSPAFTPNDGKKYLHNQRIGKISFHDKDILPKYVYIFFNSRYFRSELANTCTGMKVRHTSPQRILRVQFALPPLAEQHRIVAKVEQLMALVDRYEAQLATAQDTATRLLDALVRELTGTTRAVRSPVAPASAGRTTDHLALEAASETPQRTDDAQHNHRPKHALRLDEESILPEDEEAHTGAISTTPPSRLKPALPTADTQAALLALLRARGSLSSSEAQAATGLDSATLRALFKTLIDQGHARTEGQRRGMRYLAT